MSQYTVAELVAEFLEKCDVDTAFGIVSVHNIPMLDGVARRGKIRFVMTRGEMGAGHMADAYARVTRKLGVVFTSTGPGAANAASALVEAGFASSPVLHITGQSMTKHIGRGRGAVHDVPDQLGMLKSISKTAYRIGTPDQALSILKRAVADALSAPMGPVSIEIPIDVQKSVIDRPAELDALVLPIAALRIASTAEMDRLVALVSQAKRPMLWLGNGARDAASAATKLLDLGFGLVTSWAGRGIVPDDHPMSIGALNGTGAPLVEAFYDTVDLLLVVGSRLRGHETMDATARLPKNIIQIDIDPMANDRTYKNQAFVCAEAASTLEALSLKLKGKISIDPKFENEFKAMKIAAFEEFRQTLGPYSSFPDQVRNAMPRDAIWVRDITLNNSTWGNKLFPLYDGCSSAYPIGAAIGPGLSLGIGAAIGAHGRKTVAMVGDGGFFLNVGELWTAVQENVDLVVLVMNDGGYGVIQHIQDATCEGRRNYYDLLGPDLKQLAALAGIPFMRVSEASTLGATLSKALMHKGVTLVEVTMNSIGEFPPYFPYSKK